MARTRWPPACETPASCPGQADRTGRAGGCQRLGPGRQAGIKTTRTASRRKAGQTGSERSYARTPQNRGSTAKHYPHPPAYRCAAGAPGDLQRLEDPADRRCANPVADLEQLTLDPLVSPAIVLRGEPLDERGDLGADWRPSRPVRIGPLPGDQAACQRRTVPGVTSRCGRSLPGRSRISAAITARSAQSSRGRGWVRRSTATSCRSTKSSASLEADDRPSRTSQPQSRTKMR